MLPYVVISMANLYKYFKRQSLPTSAETGLPEAITREAKTAVEMVLEKKHGGTSAGSKRKYTHLATEARARITKYMVECGNSATVRHLSREFPLLKESTVRLFKKQYMEELKPWDKKR